MASFTFNTLVSPTTQVRECQDTIDQCPSSTSSLEQFFHFCSLSLHFTKMAESDLNWFCWGGIQLDSLSNSGTTQDCANLNEKKKRQIINRHTRSFPFTINLQQIQAYPCTTTAIPPNTTTFHSYNSCTFHSPQPQTLSSYPQ